jgi:hypothetical protein
MSATEQAYLKRYQAAAGMRESFYMPQPVKDGKANMSGFWYPMLFAAFVGGVMFQRYLGANAGNG